MDKDRAKGAAHEAKGAVKEAAGKVTGDAKTQAEGKAEKVGGKVQNAAGGAKDAVRGTMNKTVRGSAGNRQPDAQNRTGAFFVQTLIAEIYRSSNGDRWTLIRNGNSGRLLVRHEPNPSSGGRVSETDVDEFLSVAGSGPEYAALRILLDRPADTAPSSQ